MATIRQFINECNNYEYSQEYFEIMKECEEIKLMERYIQNQKFMESNDSDTQNVSDQTKKKKELLIVRIFNYIIRQIRRFGHWVASLFKKSKSDKVDSKKLEDEVVDAVSDAASNKSNVDTASDTGSTKSDVHIEHNKFDDVMVEVKTYIDNNIKYLKPVPRYSSGTFAKALTASLNDHSLDKYVQYLAMLMDTKMIVSIVDLPRVAGFPSAMLTQDILNILKELYDMIKEPGTLNQQALLKIQSKYTNKTGEMVLFDYKSTTQYDTSMADDMLTSIDHEIASESFQSSVDIVTLAALNQFISSIGKVIANNTTLYTDLYNLNSQYREWLKKILDATNS